MIPVRRSMPRIDVALRVGDEQPAAPPRQALGAGQKRAARRPAVARVALFTGAGHVVDRLRPRVDAMDGVALAQRQVEIAAVVERHRARAVQRRARDRRTVGRGLPFAGAGKGGDDASGQFDGPHAMVPDVADEQSPAVGRDGDGMRLAKGGRGRRPAVSREAWLAGAGHRRDHLGARVHLADDVVVALGDVEVPVPVEHRFVRHVQGGAGRRAAVAGVPLLAIAGDGGRAARPQVEPAEALVVEVAEDERAVRSEDDAVGIVHLLVGVARAARADHGGDGGRGPCHRSLDQQRQQRLERATAVHRRHDTSSAPSVGRATMTVRRCWRGG